MLEGIKVPVNDIVFNEKATLVATGGLRFEFQPVCVTDDIAGDDQEVNIWDLETSKCVQRLASATEQWGQITAIKFAEIEGHSWIFFGTGFGIFFAFRFSRKTVSQDDAQPYGD